MDETRDAVFRSAVRQWRIAVVTETYPPEINGVANTMEQLVTRLAARGHRLQLIRPRQPSDPDQCAFGSIDVHQVPGLPLPGYRGLRLGLPVYWRLHRLWEKTPVDLVYIATQGPLGHAALAAAQAHSIATATGFHTQFQQYSGYYGFGFLAHPIGELLRHFHNRSDATFVPTPDLRTVLLRQGFHDVQVFGRGVDLTRFSPLQRDVALRRAWGCDDATLVLLCVGRIAPEKNLDLALEVYRAILTQHGNSRLILVGDGPARERLERDHPDLICPGPLVGEALARVYASADLFLFPSLTETFGNVVLEAMASGLPVVAFDQAAAHLLIETGRNGVKAPPGDPSAFIAASLALAGDRMRLRRLGLQARRSAEHTGWDRVIRDLEQGLDRIIQSRRQFPSCGLAVVNPSKFMPSSTSVHRSETLAIENDDKAKSRVD
jgi:glycosyltransferase involved in cell wall biosynthesis